MDTMRRLKRYEEFEDESGRRVRYRRLDDGGVVALDAEVAESAVLGEGTWVDPGARVLARARLGTACWVEPGAVVGEDARLGVGVHVGRDAVVGRRAWIGDRTEIGARARVEVDVTLDPDTRVPDDVHVGAAARRSAA